VHPDRRGQVTAGSGDDVDGDAEIVGRGGEQQPDIAFRAEHSARPQVRPAARATAVSHPVPP
jgi:hypothetical protein